MTIEEARKLIYLIPRSAYTRNIGMGDTNYDEYAESLKAAFPEFNWRIILDRSGERTHWRLTIDDDDPREHYVPVGGVCIHCGKTAAELGVDERHDGDDEEVDTEAYAREQGQAAIRQGLLAQEARQRHIG
jgi:hypothetical protein